ncbi:MAG: hypothetical protein HEQ38_11000 [Gemmatimonas sp.]|nr:hypothetical protein [Gemmatimonas sp.]
MACSTEGAVIPRYAVATVGLMMANGAGSFGLFLLSRGAPCSTSREAMRRLHDQIHLQIVQRVEAVLDRDQFDSPDAYIANVQQRAERAASLVVPALASCRANRINDFRRWLDRRINDAIAGDPLAAPPAAVPVPMRNESTLPLPTSPRDSETRLSAVLRALPRNERRVLEVRASAGGRSWTHVAERVGLSVHAARRLHARALAHARELALELLSGRPLTLPPADATDQAA